MYIHTTTIVLICECWAGGLWVFLWWARPENDMRSESKTLRAIEWRKSKTLTAHNSRPAQHTISAGAGSSTPAHSPPRMAEFGVGKSWCGKHASARHNIDGMQCLTNVSSHILVVLYNTAPMPVPICRNLMWYYLYGVAVRERYEREWTHHIIHLQVAYSIMQTRVEVASTRRRWRWWHTICSSHSSSVRSDLPRQTKGLKCVYTLFFWFDINMVSAATRTYSITVLVRTSLSKFWHVRTTRVPYKDLSHIQILMIIVLLRIHSGLSPRIVNFR